MSCRSTTMASRRVPSASSSNFLKSQTVIPVAGIQSMPESSDDPLLLYIIIKSSEVDTLQKKTTSFWLTHLLNRYTSCQWPVCYSSRKDKVSHALVVVLVHMFVNIYRQYRSGRRALWAWNGSEQFTRGVCRNFLRRFHSVAIIACRSSLTSLIQLHAKNSQTRFLWSG